MANKNRIAYAICSAHGIDTTGMSPKEAWEKAKEVADKNELADLTQDSPKETKKEEPKEEKVDYNALRMGKKQNDSDKQDKGEETRNFNNFHKEQDKPKSNHKSETRKDKYGNPLVSDEAFNIGVRAVKDYIEESAKYGDSHNKLKTSNVYVDALQDVISDAISDSGLNPDFDLTYQDFNEIIGAATGDEIDIESDPYDSKFKAWTGKKYSGYQPKKEVKSTDYNALRMGKTQPETSNDEPIDYENIEYPKGTSKKYTKYVNEQFENAKPILKKAGIKLEDFGGKPSKEGGYEDNTKEIMNKYVFEPFRKKYPNGNNDVWEKEYQPLYDAIEAVVDKNYNDWYIRNNKK